jgi:hypothetical protein
MLTLIRRQYEELEREKQNLLLEQTSHQQTFRSELEKIAAEKEYEQKFSSKLGVNFRNLVRFGNNI